MRKARVFSKDDVMKKRILVIDDDAMNLKMAEHILKKNAFEVVTANSGAMGIAMLKQSKFDLVLLDIDMPVLNGIETLEAIRKDEAIADAKVVFVTASGYKKDVTEAMRLGALDFVKKPFFPDELLSRIDKAIAVSHKDHILVVDDDRMNQLFAKKMLGVRYDVDMVSSGMEALYYLKVTRPDLILLDLHMPEINGLQVMEELQKSEEYQDIPVIFLTADTEQQTEIELFKAGAKDFITKPFAAEVVIQRVARILDMQHLQNSLKEEVERKTVELSEANLRMHNLSTQVTMALASAIDAKDPYTNGHSTRVAEYSREIARRLGRPQQEIDDIYYVALLHDVGKIGIPDYIINKQNNLTDEEYEKIKAHPVIGAQILEKVSELPDICVAAHWHHEKYDGTGYPDGLAGENIPLPARIVGVADAYDAMASKRSYRDVLPQEIVRAEIAKGSGTQFDPIIADVMLQMIDEDVNYSMREKC